MSGRHKAGHAMKITKRTNRVKHVSFSFDNMTTDQVEAFRLALKRRLNRQIRQNCKFRVIARQGRLDWYITFEHSWPERELDRDINAVATEHEMLMFIEPGIPESEMTADLSSYLFWKRPPGDRPSNA